MCGICGIIGENNSSLIRAMSNEISYRGPDDDGYFCDNNVSLGFKRLSIIDLAKGKQPIQNENKSCTVIFNGEIYNYKQLQKELKEKGHEFATDSDTETIVHGYEEWNESVFSYLRGMFSIALYDSEKKIIFLARDRLGIKPLFFYKTSDVLIFGSEPKVILASKYYKFKINNNALASYLFKGYNDQNETIYQGIYKVPPGCYIKCNIRPELVLEKKKYWELKLKNSSISLIKGKKKLEKMLEDAVQSHLISDVPVGIFLSGGIDSSGIAAIMSKMGVSVNSYSVGFGGYGDDELTEAKQVAELLNTNHNEIIVKPQSVKNLKEILWFLDEPLADLAIVPVYYMSKFASKNVKVILTGDGNDEIWGGYSHYRRQNSYYNLGKKFKKILPTIIKLANPFLFKNPKLKYDINYINELINNPTNYRNYCRVFNLENISHLCNTQLSNQLINIWKKRNLYKLQFEDFINHMLIQDTSTLLPDSYLVKTDRMTMAASIEARVPLIDHNIVEFAFSLPGIYKVHKEYDKYIYRLAIRKFLPKEISLRKKRGFAVPIHYWYDETRSFVADVLESKKFYNRKIFKTSFIKKILARKQKEILNSTQIWTLISIELWLENLEERNYI
jgi:asparagine synthase (glutamine-hydrolysing)